MKEFIFKSFRKSAGFTLIELLVVIGILGVLAAALIAAINPIEQINKAGDTSVQNVSVAFIQGLQSYVTTHQMLPWDANSGVTGCANSTINNTLLSGLPPTCISALTGEGDLNSTYTSSPSNILQRIYITQVAAVGSLKPNTVSACYLPLSKAFETESATAYYSNGVPVAGGSGGSNANGSTPTNCQLSNASNCYWCTQ